MDKEFNTKVKIEKYVEELDKAIYEVDKFVGFLNLDKEREKALHESIKILKKKSKKIKSSRTIDEVSDVLKVKKLKKKFGDSDG